MLLLPICTPGWREMVKQNFLTTQMIPPLISFRNKFISSPHTSMYFFTSMTFCSCRSHSGRSSFWFSIQVKFLFWCWTLFLKHEVENNFTPNWKMQITCSLEQVAHVYLIWHKNCLCKREHPRLNQWCECSMNYILEQHLFWNHSWPVSCKQTIRWQHDSKAWTWNNSSKIQGVTLLPSHHASTDTPVRASYTLQANQFPSP